MAQRLMQAGRCGLLSPETWSAAIGEFGILPADAAKSNPTTGLGV